MIQHPRYKHDCERCRFIGWVDKADGYICMGTSEQSMRIRGTFITGSVVLRHSDHGTDYSSMSLESVCDSRHTQSMGRYREIVELALTSEGKTIPEGKIDASFFKY